MSDEPDFMTRPRHREEEKPVPKAMQVTGIVIVCCFLAVVAAIVLGFLAWIAVWIWSAAL